MPDLDTYKDRRRWSDKYMPAVKAALGRHFFHETTLEQDTQIGIDLFVSNFSYFES